MNKSSDSNNKISSNSNQEIKIDNEGSSSVSTNLEIEFLKTEILKLKEIVFSKPEKQSNPIFLKDFCQNWKSFADSFDWKTVLKREFLCTYDSCVQVRGI